MAVKICNFHITEIYSYFLSTSIYDLVLIYVCHFHHHYHHLTVTPNIHFSSFFIISNNFLTFFNSFVTIFNCFSALLIHFSTYFYLLLLISTYSILIWPNCYLNLTTIEILVLLSWIFASKEFSQLDLWEKTELLREIDFS